MRRVSRATRRGFSAIELLTTLVIIGAMAAIALPRVDIDGYHMDGAAQSIGTSLLAAQREAVSRQHNVLVIFDTATSTIRTVWDANNNEQPDGGERVRALPLHDRMRMGRPSSVPARPGMTDPIAPMLSYNGRPMLVFQRNGSTDRTAWFYFASARALGGDPSRTRHTRFVEIARATGRPSWWRYSGSTWTRSF
jgi:prepilin-type N-terminal cleavage/methylation domain-containing protein